MSSCDELFHLSMTRWQKNNRRVLQRQLFFITFLQLGPLVVESSALWKKRNQGRNVWHTLCHFIHFDQIKVWSQSQRQPFNICSGAFKRYSDIRRCSALATGLQKVNNCPVSAQYDARLSSCYILHSWLRCVVWPAIIHVIRHRPSVLRGMPSAHCWAQPRKFIYRPVCTGL